MHSNNSSSRSYGRVGSNQGLQRGKSNSPRVSAPLPVNLPSRRHEKAGNDFSLMSQGSSWGSPLSVTTSVLGTPSAASTPGEGSSPTVPSSNTTAATQTGSTAKGPPPTESTGNDSPHLNSSPTLSSSLHKTPARAWGLVTQTKDHHLEEYPTAAEASKKNHADHESQSSNTNTTSNSTQASHGKTEHATSNTSSKSGEAMAKSVSGLSTDNNWDEVDDEGVDFLNAGEIQFADGSVVVTATTTSSEQAKDTVKSKEPTSTEPTELREERVVERGEVDFNRGWPNGSSAAAPSSSLYQHQSEPSTRQSPSDKSQSQFWQSGVRRPSADRSNAPPYSQRRDSSGHSGPNRRDSFGHKETYSGPRRDSAGHRDGHRDGHFERRDSFENRDRGYNRMPNHSRDREFSGRDINHNPERRPSYERPHYNDRMPERHHQRDFQLLTRPKDHLSDRHGPHDPLPSGHPMGGHPTPGYRSHGSMGVHDSGHKDSGFNHANGHVGDTEDRPIHVTEDQTTAMKNAAEEARKRRLEEEREFQESQARARAKADELAKKAEAKKAQEEEANKAKKAQEEEANKATAAKTSQFKTPLMTAAERDQALANWKALPEKLTKETHENQLRNQEAWRQREAEYRRQKDGGSAAKEGAGQAASKGKDHPPVAGAEQEIRTGQLDKVMHQIEDKLQARGKSVQQVGASMKSPSDTVATSPKEVTSTTVGAEATPSAESGKLVASMDEKDVAKDRTRGAKGARGKSTVAEQQASSGSWRKEQSQPKESAKAKESNKHKESTAPAPHETADSWRRTETRPSAGPKEDLKEKDESKSNMKPEAKEDTQSKDETEAKEQPKESKKTTSTVLEAKPQTTIMQEEHSQASSEDDTAKRATPSVLPRSPQATPATMKTTENKEDATAPAPVAVAEVAPESYPAATVRAEVAMAKVSQISRIYKRISTHPAGSVLVGSRGESGPDRAKTSAKNQAKKRNSLSNSTVATIFPDYVEQAALKRGSMSFMVESEIDLQDKKHEEKSEDKTEPAAVSLQGGGDKKSLPQLAPTLNNADMPANDSAKKAWDSTMASEMNNGNHAPVSGSVQAANRGGNLRSHGFPRVSAAPPGQGMPVGPNLYLMSAQGGANPMTQHLWSQPVESNQSSPMAAGAPVSPFPVMMPYYNPYTVNGPPPFVYMVPQGRMHQPPHLAPYPGRALPSSGDQHVGMEVSPPVSPSDGGFQDSATGASERPAGTVKEGSSDKTHPPQPAQTGADSNAASATFGPHHWLPRFSAAGDAPQPQAPFVVQAPQANLLAAANINRVPQSRPYGGPHQQLHHPQPRRHSPPMQRRHGSPGRDLMDPTGPSLITPNGVSGLGDDAGSPPTDNWASPSSHPHQKTMGGNGNFNHHQQHHHHHHGGDHNFNGHNNHGLNNGAQNPQVPPMVHPPHQHHSGGYAGFRGGRGGYHQNNNHHREFRPNQNGRGGYGHQVHPMSSQAHHH
ncbi:hypothetical protein BGZ94_006907 [Podila epigama]|nr:hypothetical protein BGZ94_006907 [Podila epigama]